MSATSPQQNVDKAVLKYLQERGYESALDAFKREANILEGSDVSLEEFAQRNTSSRGITGNDVLLRHLAAEETAHPGGDLQSAEQYTLAYQSLAEWIYSSLDIYKNELIQVLYPVFVHCYFEMVQKRHRNKAIAFLNRFKSHHAHFHLDEITTLHSIQSTEQMYENEFARKLLRNKFIIRISQASFELLMKFLQDASELNLLAIINQFITFKKYRGQPNLVAPALAVDSRMLLERKKPKKSKRKRAEESASYWDELERDLDLVKRNESVPVTWEVMQQQIMERASLDAQVKSETQRKAEEELRRMTRGASSADPSVCFYTMFNCKSELNTIELSPNRNVNTRSNGPVIAAGFADSVIRCWNWNGSSTTVPSSDTVNADGDAQFGSTNAPPLNGMVQQRNRQQQQQQTQKQPQHNAYSTLIGHSGPVYGLSFSSDNRWLLSCSEDNTARLWNVETESNVVTYKGHQFPVWDVSFSAFDYLFVTASHDRTARVWSTDRVTPIRILAGHLSDVECVKFHPNCNYVATGSSDKTVRLWDVQSGECVRMFIGHYGTINTLTFSKDGRYLASTGEDKAVFVWDIGTGRIVNEFRGYHKDVIWSMDFNYDGGMLVTGSNDCTVRVFDTHMDIAAQNRSREEIRRHAKCSHTFFTKQTPVFKVKFVERDVVLAAGPFGV